MALYVAPLFLAAPLWARQRLDMLEHLTARALVADVLVTSLAFARFVAGERLPFSGHMLFLAYTLLTPGLASWYRLLAVVLLVETTVFKLWLWSDATSWALGLVLGVGAAAVVFSRRRLATT
jgi:hypothetical protein